ncbi:GDP-fucose protein O-fucosyltransferase 2 [Chamberlinius hualienensis]
MDILIISTLLLLVPVLGEDSVCIVNGHDNQEPLTQLRQSKRYLFYEVNPGEGFNLRRDVYIRIANLVRKLRNEGDDWVLVLPPWGPLYHWKTKWPDFRQIQIPWSHFFNLESLNSFIPVIELTDFLKGFKHIDVVYVCQYFADTFDSGKTWIDKYEVSDCLESPTYEKLADGTVEGWFWGYNDNLHALNYSCLSLQGQVSTLLPFLHHLDIKSVLLDRAEIILHDSFGDVNYWMARRSMRYSNELIEIANKFRKEFLNSTDDGDGTTISKDWLKVKKSKNNVIGGPYIAVHLRRGDFLHGRNRTVPNLKNAATQIKKKMKQLKLNLVFISTDALKSEFQELKNLLPSAVRFVPSSKQLRELLDGGVAIVDQWICAHARYFIGTSESTFSFRIEEDREIIGFDPDTTFNRLCGDPEGDKCEQPTRWRIVY